MLHACLNVFGWGEQTIFANLSFFVPSPPVAQLRVGDQSNRLEFFYFRTKVTT